MSRDTASARGALAGTSPVARLGAALALTLCLVATIDSVSAAVALVLEIALLPFAGVTWRRFWLRTAPVWSAAPLAGITVLLYGQTSGAVHWEFLLVRVSDGSAALAIATTLRILAIGLPAVILFTGIDPTDLADGLAQLVRLPARFVLGALAGLRLVGLFLDDWRSLELARRARGVADRGRLRRFGGQAFALLVLSIRRGSKLATAMEARGFGAPGPRSWARPARFGAAEVGLILLGAGIGAAAVTASIATGNWNAVIG